MRIRKWHKAGTCRGGTPRTPFVDTMSSILKHVVDVYGCEHELSNIGLDCTHMENMALRDIMLLAHALAVGRSQKQWRDSKCNHGETVRHVSCEGRSTKLIMDGVCIESTWEATQEVSALAHAPTVRSPSVRLIVHSPNHASSRCAQKRPGPQARQLPAAQRYTHRHPPPRRITGSKGGRMPGPSFTPTDGPTDSPLMMYRRAASTAPKAKATTKRPPAQAPRRDHGGSTGEATGLPLRVAARPLRRRDRPGAAAWGPVIHAARSCRWSFLGGSALHHVGCLGTGRPTGLGDTEDCREPRPQSGTFGASTRAAESTPHGFPLLVVPEWTFSHGLLLKFHRMGQRREVPIRITRTPIGICTDGRSSVSVRPGGGADRAGLRAGDVISQIQGQDAWVCHANNVVRALNVIGEILAMPPAESAKEGSPVCRNAATTGPRPQAAGSPPPSGTGKATPKSPPRPDGPEVEQCGVGWGGGRAARLAQRRRNPRSAQPRVGYLIATPLGL